MNIDKGTVKFYSWLTFGISGVVCLLVLASIYLKEEPEITVKHREVESTTWEDWDVPAKDRYEAIFTIKYNSVNLLTMAKLDSMLFDLRINYFYQTLFYKLFSPRLQLSYFSFPLLLSFCFALPDNIFHRHSGIQYLVARHPLYVGKIPQILYALKLFGGVGSVIFYGLIMDGFNFFKGHFAGS